jgi:hypothetical protein
MARYQLDGSGWPVDQFLIPPGTVIDTYANADGWSLMVSERGLWPPITAQPLDAATYETMVQLYGAWRVAPLKS